MSLDIGGEMGKETGMAALPDWKDAWKQARETAPTVIAYERTHNPAFKAPEPTETAGEGVCSHQWHDTQDEKVQVCPVCMAERATPETMPEERGRLPWEVPEHAGCPGCGWSYGSGHHS